MTKPFLWGAATSAHQVEGNNLHNDWWQWEQQAGRVRSGLACDHYRLFDQDFALARALGHTAHRLSLEWSRLELAPGRWNERAVEHYREVLLSLRRHQLQSFVTLHHFTNPQWFAAQGGWANRRAPAQFRRYAQFVVDRLGDLVDVWLTINEPMIYVMQGYWSGVWPPGKQDRYEGWRVIRHLARAHELAYLEIHHRYPAAQVGVAHHLTAYAPASQNKIADRVVTRLADWWFNHRFIRLTRGSHDFLGVNYYQSFRKSWQWWPPRLLTDLPPGPRTDMGWAIDPGGLTRVLEQLKVYRLPIYITENGLADADDDQRSDFIRDHLRAVEAAQVRGVDVRGYLHWSLLDNFEWADGFTPRFGLVAVDYATQARTPRRSAYVYKAIIEQARSTR